MNDSIGIEGDRINGCSRVPYWALRLANREKISSAKLLTSFVSVATRSLAGKTGNVRQKGTMIHERCRTF